MSMLTQRKRARKGDGEEKEEEKELQEGEGKMTVTADRGEGLDETHRIILVTEDQPLEEPENSEEELGIF